MLAREETSIFAAQTYYDPARYRSSVCVSLLRDR